MPCPLHLLGKAGASSQKTNNAFHIRDVEGWNEKMQKCGGPWTHSQELAEIWSVLHVSIRSCVMVLPAPAQTAAGFWLGKGWRVQVQCVYLYSLQGPAGTLAAPVFLWRSPIWTTSGCHMCLQQYVGKPDFWEGSRGGKRAAGSQSEARPFRLLCWWRWTTAAGFFPWKEVSLWRRGKETLGLTGDMANRHEQAASYLKSKREGEKGRGRLKEMGKFTGGKVRRRDRWRHWWSWEMEAEGKMLLCVHRQCGMQPFFHVPDHTTWSTGF